jgi:hypothetical protein
VSAVPYLNSWRDAKHVTVWSSQKRLSGGEDLGLIYMYVSDYCTPAPTNHGIIDASIGTQHLSNIVSRVRVIVLRSAQVAFVAVIRILLRIKPI